MAACLNHIATFLFLFAVAITTSQLHVHARESKFFSKVTNHISVSSKTTVPDPEDPLGAPIAAPELSPAPALSPVSTAEEFSYRSGSSGVPSSQEMNSADRTSVDEFERNISGEELVGESFNTGYDNAFSNNFNYNSNVNARSGGGYSSGDVYQTESQQGMSDTRYLENGRFFYNMKSENSYGNTYKPEERTATGNNYNANENGSDAYEFDTMEEYYRKQGVANPQDQGVYVP